jgi:UrcA family protein
MIRTFQALSVAALAFAAVAAPATAAETQRTAVEVHYADLNLNSEAGAATLIRRLDVAAKQVCGLDSRQRGFVRRQQRACHEQTLSKAIVGVDAPLVTQMFAGEQGRRQVFAAR